MGKIGKSIESIVEEKTPLQLQIGNFVKKLSLIGLLIFGIVWAINFYNSGLFLDSLLKDYDKRVRPEYSGPAVDVGITSKNAIKIFKLKMISI